MSNDTRIAVIGCGHWGKQHCRVAEKLGVLTAICDLDESRMEAAMSVFPKQYNSLIFGANTPDDIFALNDYTNAVIIATPAETHYDLATQALKAGKHVLVEKPMAMSAQDAKDMAMIAEYHERVLMVGHVMLYHPGFTVLARMVQNGDLGRLMYLYSNRLNFGKVRQYENVMWSFAPHDISMILHLLKESPTHTDAWGGEYLGPVEDVTLLMMEFPFNMSAHIHVSWLHPFKDHKFVVVGSKKMAVLDDATRTLTLYNQHIELDTNGLPLHVNGEKATLEIDLRGENEPLYREQQDFIRCIQTGDTPIASARNGIEVTQVLNDAEKALQEKAHVSCLR